MRTGLTLIATAATGLLMAGIVAAGPAYASSNSLTVEGGTGQQYIVSCESSSGCNSVAAGTLQISFLLSAPVSSPLGIDYKIINGTAVDGTDFNTPATGQVTVPTDMTYAFLNVPLVNEKEFGTSKTFTIEVTGTSSPITISTGTATNTITGGNIPQDCSFTYISTTSQSLSCTKRPASQVWSIEVHCKANMGPPWIFVTGSDVTGDGTSTVSGCNTLNSGGFVTDS
jgi:hypothetical protein